MSRVGKQNIIIPEKTEVTLKDGILTVKGPKGEISRYFKDNVEITIADKSITLLPKRNDIATRALWGTYASHISNMIQGVVTPFSKKLIIEGIGFKAEVQGKNLNLNLGFSHPILKAIPEGLTVVHEKGTLTISGVDKDNVGEFAAKIRSLKKPEPYKGKGIRYDNEVVRRKQGKKSV
ncbi:MAG: 50S ribosomal protein L6 [Candidatus Paceibacterota bacterium]|jgi:large subunit ribosomal protein L6